MSKIKLAIIGNCQAEALRSIVFKVAPEFDVIKLPEYYEIDPEKSDLVLSELDKADIVFAQRVSRDYQIEHVRPNYLRARYGRKCTIWPNIYFDGYFPGLRYVYDDEGKKITGPLGDYHFEQVIRSWFDGQDPQDAADNLMSAKGWPFNAGDPSARSLEQLRQREADCDVKISDHFERNLYRRKLMYSMNHPTNSVLLEMLDRLMENQSFKGDFRFRAAHQRERLNQIDIPELPRFKEFKNQKLDTQRKFEIMERNKINIHMTNKTVDAQELVNLFYQSYTNTPYLQSYKLQHSTTYPT